jgi:hypothetical protein
MFYLLIKIEVLSHVRLYFLLSLNIALFINKDQSRIYSNFMFVESRAPLIAQPRRFRIPRKSY